MLPSTPAQRHQRAHSAERSGRCRESAAVLPRYANTIRLIIRFRTRGPVDRVLQRRGDRAVVPDEAIINPSLSTISALSRFAPLRKQSPCIPPNPGRTTAPDPADRSKSQSTCLLYGLGRDFSQLLVMRISSQASREASEFWCAHWKVIFHESAFLPREERRFTSGWNCTHSRRMSLAVDNFLGVICICSTDQVRVGTCPLMFITSKKQSKSFLIRRSSSTWSRAVSASSRRPAVYGGSGASHGIRRHRSRRDRAEQGRSSPSAREATDFRRGSPVRSLTASLMSAEITVNAQKALRDYHVLENSRRESSSRARRSNPSVSAWSICGGSFARIGERQLYLFDSDIQPYLKASHEQHEAKRPRRLLLHRMEIERLAAGTRAGWPHSYRRPSLLEGRQGEGRTRHRQRARSHPTSALISRSASRIAKPRGTRQFPEEARVGGRVRASRSRNLDLIARRTCALFLNDTTADLHRHRGRRGLLRRSASTMASSPSRTASRTPSPRSTCS